MITLGASYGAQAAGSVRALLALNPMPYKVVAVEPEPENYQWTRKHLRDNDIDPDGHWLLQLAISDKNDPVLFPIGSPGTGAQNCIATNEAAARKVYAEEIVAAGKAEQTLRKLMLTNGTGITKYLLPGEIYPAEIKIVSANTLKDLLSPFDRVDYLESDIQQSEIAVFPPFMPLLKRKVKRVHIGTHGQGVHALLAQLFETNGWEIIFNYAPNADYKTGLGTFSVNNGALTIRNPSL